MSESEQKLASLLTEMRLTKARLDAIETKLGIPLPVKPRLRGAEYPKMVYNTDGTSRIVNGPEEESEEFETQDEDEVEIPANWEELHPQKIISIAKKIGVEGVTTKDDAIATIQLELERRDKG